MFSLVVDFTLRGIVEICVYFSPLFNVIDSLLSPSINVIIINCRLDFSLVAVAADPQLLVVVIHWLLCHLHLISDLHTLRNLSILNERRVL